MECCIPHRVPSLKQDTDHTGRGQWRLTHPHEEWRSFLQFSSSKCIRIQVQVGNCLCDIFLLKSLFWSHCTLESCINVPQKCLRKLLNDKFILMKNWNPGIKEYSKDLWKYILWENCIDFSCMHQNKLIFFYSFHKHFQVSLKPKIKNHRRARCDHVCIRRILL